jgi:hypothetical protein
MSIVVSSRGMVRGALCAVVASVITVAGVWGFETSTAHAPGYHSTVAVVVSTKIPLAHSVFGRPQPAVLVD